MKNYSIRGVAAVALSLLAAVNAAGQVAVRATLADGRQLVLRADPVR
jgi:hypothetical protein